MTVPNAPECLFCTRYHRDDLENFTCDAFPEGIPEAIILSEVKHRTSIPGDHGLTFEAVSPVEPVEPTMPEVDV